MLPASSAASSNNIWDCFHVNSVEEGPDNTLLVSMRNMWAIYNIDKKKEISLGSLAASIMILPLVRMLHILGSTMPVIDV